MNDTPRHRSWEPADGTTATAAPAVFFVAADRLSRRSHERLLRAFKLRCSTFADLDAFVAAYGREPGCVAIDLHGLPLSAAACIRALSERAVDLPVIFLDGRTHRAERSEVVDDGRVVAVLRQPAEPRELVALVHRLHPATD